MMRMKSLTAKVETDPDGEIWSACLWELSQTNANSGAGPAKGKQIETT